jgi:hypothetical protein
MPVKPQTQYLLALVAIALGFMGMIVYMDRSQPGGVNVQLVKEIGAILAPFVAALFAMLNSSRNATEVKEKVEAVAPAVATTAATVAATVAADTAASSIINLPRPR